MTNVKKLRVAIVHDWLTGGGAELVVEQLHAMFPEAPIYTSYCTDEWRERLDGKVVTGWLQPFGKIRKFLPPLRIIWFTQLKFDGYDVVISSSGAEAKGIHVPTGTVHINYCHSPTHYYWMRYDQYLKNPGFGKLDWLARWGLKTLVGPLRRWDFRAAKRPDIMIANSSHTQAMIKKYYKRDSVVVHPPVDVDRFGFKKDEPRHGYVVVGRQTPYKRIDLAVEACTQLGVPLVVIGNGPDHKRLEKLAGRSVTFLTNTSDGGVAEHFRTALACLFPGIDDFGITPVEAMASGTPVIAYKAGGALDYIVPGKTGEFFDKPTTASLVATLETFKPSKYSPDDIKASAEQFSAKNFRENIHKVLTDTLQ